MQFRNLLIIFNQIYYKNYGYIVLNESYLFNLLSDKPYRPRDTKDENGNIKKSKEEKLQEYNDILQNIDKVQELKEFIVKLKQQKDSVKNVHVIQSVIRQYISDYNSYFKSLNEYTKKPNKFRGKPRPPKAKKLKDIISFTVELNSNSFEIIDGRYILVRLTFDDENSRYIKVKLPEYIDREKIKSIRIKTIGTDAYIDVVYTKKIKIPETEKQYIAGIDLGLNNLLTIFSNNPSLRTLIVGGKEIKSFNQWFNKEKAKIQSEIDLLQNQINKLSKDGLNIDNLKLQIKTLINKQKQLSAFRERYLNNIFHQITRKIADYLYETGHKKVIIGNGAMSSKDGIDLGNKTNQHFVSIPFRKIIDMLKYKLEEYGIEVEEISEEFTSKTSPFANLNEVLEIGEEYLKVKRELKNTDLSEEELNQLKEKEKELKEQLNTLYNGKRIKRGLFKDFITNKVFNADAVGSYNILRKVAMPLINNTKLLIDKLSRPVKLKLKDLLQVSRDFVVEILQITGSRQNRVLCKIVEGYNFL
ncbi:RNA-guided endonuclease TnpB family protein [Venenivibrio stagnispumantis]